MGKRLYCGNLPFSATAEDIRALFGEGGRTVTDVHIVTDRETGRSRGFAFVELGSDQEADEAIRSVNGRNYGGRALAVKEALDRQARPGGDRPGFGGPPRGPRPDRPGFGGPRGPGGPGGPGAAPRGPGAPGFGGPPRGGGFGAGPRGPGGPGGPQVERRPGYGPGGGGGGYGRDRGFGGGGYGGGYGRDFPPEPMPIPEPEYAAAPIDYSEPPPEGYSAPEDVDYRERGDRGKRGRDRRGGRRRGGDDFGGPEW